MTSMLPEQFRNVVARQEPARHGHAYDLRWDDDEASYSVRINQERELQTWDYMQRRFGRRATLHKSFHNTSCWQKLDAEAVPVVAAVIAHAKTHGLFDAADAEREKELNAHLAEKRKEKALQRLRDAAPLLLDACHEALRYLNTHEDERKVRRKLTNAIQAADSESE
jgi:hypothetical protein